MQDHSFVPRLVSLITLVAMLACDTPLESQRHSDLTATATGPTGESESTSETPMDITHEPGNTVTPKHEADALRCSITLHDPVRQALLILRSGWLVPELQGRDLSFGCPPPSDRQDATLIVEKTDGNHAYARVDLSTNNVAIVHLEDGLPTDLDPKAMAMARVFFGRMPPILTATPTEGPTENEPRKNSPIPITFSAYALNSCELRVRRSGATIATLTLDPSAAFKLEPGVHSLQVRTEVGGMWQRAGALDVELDAKACVVEMLDAPVRPRMDCQRG